MIKRLLIANRGEIACRIIDSCRHLGIATVAVYSEADRNALHVQRADQAHLIGGAAPSESYLRGDKLLEVAQRTAADAVHPGYGFLSENPEFARRCEQTGLNFVGPSAATMDQMGSKADAKRIMVEAGVPTVPGYHGDDQSPGFLAQEANVIGFPLMIKAAAGGGGKGMRIVHRADEFEAALAAAQREAAGAFGDQQVILERYLQNPRHIEVQVFGDRHGNIVHLFERDCSSQRRYQKVIEEAPSASLTEAQRAAIYRAATAAAEAVDYVNAGTVEFIVDGAQDSTGDGFYFMEMNTRLQVEHPVTEMITGLDLVEWQLRIAAGEALPLKQDQIQRRGHAIEARIYAEDPEQGFLPSAGPIHWFTTPPSVRVDSGVAQGGEVTVHYDPMIAKLIVHGDDREQALEQMASALTRTAIAGPKNNVDFLLALVRSEVFRQGQIHTAWLDRHLDELLGAQTEPPAPALLAAALAELLTTEAQSVGRQRTLPDRHSPWAISDGWRLGHFGRRVLSFGWRGEHFSVTATGFDGRYALDIGQDGYQTNSYQVTEATLTEHSVDYTLAAGRHSVAVLRHQPWVQVAVDGRLYQLVAENPFALEVSDDDPQDQLLAPMPGKVIAIKVAPGDSVEAGQELLIMEAMKMELSLAAPRDGVVEAISAEPDAFVEADTILLSLAKPT